MSRVLRISAGVLLATSAILVLVNNSIFSGTHSNFALHPDVPPDEPSCFLSRLEGPLMAEDPQLVSYVYSNYLNPPSTKPYISSIPYSFNNSKPHFAEFARFRRYIYETFKDIDYQGFFIEAGALNGLSGSNTLYLEYEKNWTGLLIEPSKKNCKALEAAHRKAWTSCSCLSPHKFAIKSIFEIPHSKIPSKVGLFNANVRSINSRFHTFVDVIMNAVNQNKGFFTYATVQCFPLITYLLALNVTVVDLLSLDTQGGEKNMLFNFPFDKIRVNYMLIEYYKRGPFPRRQDDELVSYLDSKGFDLIRMFNTSGEYVFKYRE